MKKFILVLTAAVLISVVVGCGEKEIDPREELAARFVTAVAEGDEDTVWESFSPAFKEKIVRELWAGDESAARSGTVTALQKGMVERYGVDEAAEITDNEDLFRKAVREVLYNPGEKFIRSGEEYFLEVDLENSAKTD